MEGPRGVDDEVVDQLVDPARNQDVEGIKPLPVDELVNIPVANIPE